MSRVPGLCLYWREYKADRARAWAAGDDSHSETFLVFEVLQALS